MSGRIIPHKKYRGQERSRLTPGMMLRALLVWLVIALAEATQGYLRVRCLNRRLGDRRARQVGVGTGSVIILVLTRATSPWIGIQDEPAAWRVGALWLALMLAFDVGFGRWAFHASWARILEEFNLRRGRLLALGMAVVFVAPWAVYQLS
jgi:hypothetical protein